MQTPHVSANAATLVEVARRPGSRLKKDKSHYYHVQLARGAGRLTKSPNGYQKLAVSQSFKARLIRDIFQMDFSQLYSPHD